MVVDPRAVFATFVSLATAFVLGGLIGLEQQIRQRNAGLRTMVLVSAVAAVVLVGNTLLRPLVNWINRRPLDARTTEALYQVHIVCAPSDVADMRELLSTELEKASYPIQAIDMLAETEDWMELAASLVPTIATADELDAVVEALEAAAGVESATCTVSTMS